MPETKKILELERVLQFKWSHGLSRKKNESRQVPIMGALLDEIESLTKTFARQPARLLRVEPAFEHRVERIFHEYGPRLWPALSEDTSAWLIDLAPEDLHPYRLVYAVPEDREILRLNFASLLLEKCAKRYENQRQKEKRERAKAPRGHLNMPVDDPWITRDEDASLFDRDPETAACPCCADAPCQWGTVPRLRDALRPSNQLRVPLAPMLSIGADQERQSGEPQCDWTEPGRTTGPTAGLRSPEAHSVHVDPSLLNASSSSHAPHSSSTQVPYVDQLTGTPLSHGSGLKRPAPLSLIEDEVSSKKGRVSSTTDGQQTPYKLVVVLKMDPARLASKLAYLGPDIRVGTSHSGSLPLSTQDEDLEGSMAWTTDDSESSAPDVDCTRESRIRQDLFSFFSEQISVPDVEQELNETSVNLFTNEELVETNSMAWNEGNTASLVRTPDYPADDRTGAPREPVLRMPTPLPGDDGGSPHILHASGEARNVTDGVKTLENELILSTYATSPPRRDQVAASSERSRSSQASDIDPHKSVSRHSSSRPSLQPEQGPRIDCSPEYPFTAKASNNPRPADSAQFQAASNKGDENEDEIPRPVETALTDHRALLSTPISASPTNPRTPASSPELPGKHIPPQASLQNPTSEQNNHAEADKRSSGVSKEPDARLTSPSSWRDGSPAPKPVQEDPPGLESALTGQGTDDLQEITAQAVDQTSHDRPEPTALELEEANPPPAAPRNSKGERPKLDSEANAPSTSEVTKPPSALERTRLAVYWDSSTDCPHYIPLRSCKTHQELFKQLRRKQPVDLKQRSIRAVQIRLANAEEAGITKSPNCCIEADDDDEPFEVLIDTLGEFTANVRPQLRLTVLYEE